MVSDVIGVMNFLKIPKGSIVGWNEGDVTALFLELNFPTRIDKLFAFGANYRAAATHLNL
jgi:hypothetical protein